jgi:hypothetical protein
MFLIKISNREGGTVHNETEDGSTNLVCRNFTGSLRLCFLGRIDTAVFPADLPPQAVAGHPSFAVADHLLPDVFVVLSPSPAPPPTSIGTTLDLLTSPGEPARVLIGDGNDVDALGRYLIETIVPIHMLEDHATDSCQNHSGFGDLGEEEFKKMH